MGGNYPPTGGNRPKNRLVANDRVAIDLDSNII